MTVRLKMALEAVPAAERVHEAYCRAWVIVHIYIYICRNLFKMAESPSEERPAAESSWEPSSMRACMEMSVEGRPGLLFYKFLRAN